MDEPPPQDQVEPNDYWEEREASKKIAGLFTNQVYAQHLGDGLIRFNFGEVLDEEPRFHSAVVLTAYNAVAFGELMARMGRQAIASLLPDPPEPPQGSDSGNVE